MPKYAKLKIRFPTLKCSHMNLDQARGARRQGYRQSGITRWTLGPAGAGHLFRLAACGVLDRGLVPACSQSSLKFPLGRHNA